MIPAAVAAERGAFASITGDDLSSGLSDRDIFGGLLDEVPEGALAGATPNGGASGTGSGYGRAKSTASGLRIGNAIATGDLDKNIIRRYIRRKLPTIRNCYEKELLTSPTLSGTIVTQFQINPEGDVQGSSAKGMGNAKVEGCVAQAIKSIQFPKPKGSGFVNVRYPFTFYPAK